MKEITTCSVKHHIQTPSISLSILTTKSWGCEDGKPLQRVSNWLSSLVHLIIQSLPFPSLVVLLDKKLKLINLPSQRSLLMKSVKPFSFFFSLVLFSPTSPPLQCGTIDSGAYVNLTQRNLQDAQKFLLMHEVVQPVVPVPYFMEDNVRFTHVAVDVVQGKDTLFHIIYLATGMSIIRLFAFKSACFGKTSVFLACRAYCCLILFHPRCILDVLMFHLWHLKGWKDILWIGFLLWATVSYINILFIWSVWN